MCLEVAGAPAILQPPSLSLSPSPGAQDAHAQGTMTSLSSDEMMGWYMPTPMKSEPVDGDTSSHFPLKSPFHPGQPAPLLMHDEWSQDNSLFNFDIEVCFFLLPPFPLTLADVNVTALARRGWYLLRPPTHTSPSLLHRGITPAPTRRFVSPLGALSPIFGAGSRTQPGARASLRGPRAHLSTIHRRPTEAPPALTSCCPPRPRTTTPL